MTTPTRVTVTVRGVGLLGPGMADWPSAALRLQSPTAEGAPSMTVVPPPARLPPAERRRASLMVRASLAVAEQACSASQTDPAALATVFTSSSSDTANCHALCEALAATPRIVSPTRFTNSVHNAAAGYWHIAVHGRAPSTSLCAFDASFGAGLLEAAMQAVSSAGPVLLVACDVPYPEPLHAKRPLPDVFALAFVLDGAQGAIGARLSIGTSRSTPTNCSHPSLEALRRDIPAARALPLLQRLATGDSGEVTLDYLDPLALAVRVENAGLGQ